MAVRYKQKCPRCRKNYVTVSWRNRNVTCFECQKKEMEGTISDPKMKRMFAIPEELYKESGFLRNIKIAYLRYGKLSDRQIDAFKKAVQKIKKEKKDKPEDIKFDEHV